MSDEPQIHREYRIRRVRTSISIPEDVDAWVKWRAKSEGIPASSVYVDAVNLLARDAGVKGAPDKRDS
jgi:hypothetical protein